MKFLESIFAAFIGIVLFLCAFALLWWNEGNSAMKISIANYAAKKAIQIDANNILSENNSKLIAVTSPAVTNETLSDNIINSPKTLVLDRIVQMYQWEENKENDKVVYNKVWSENYIDSASFENKQYVNPSFPISSKTYYAKKAVLGNFNLKQKQIEKINAEEEIENLPNNYQYTKVAGQYFSGKDINTPQIGDVLISYYYAPSETPISIIAQQNSDNSLSEFPYKKSGIYIQYNGDLEKNQIIKKYKHNNFFQTTLIRLGGWLLMFLGLKLLINPVISLLKFIPFVGTMADFLSSFVLILISLILSLITIAIAWVLYRPLITILILILAGGLIYFIKRKYNLEQS